MRVREVCGESLGVGEKRVFEKSEFILGKEEGASVWARALGCGQKRGIKCLDFPGKNGKRERNKNFSKKIKKVEKCGAKQLD